MHREIMRIAPVKWEVVHLLCERENKQVKVRVERLDSWLKKIASQLEKQRESLKNVRILVIN